MPYFMLKGSAKECKKYVAIIYINLKRLQITQKSVMDEGVKI